MNENYQQSHPLVSVIVPCYNHEKYVEQCLLSILGQDYENFEVIVFDDGSTDNSSQIISQLANQYKFTFVFQENCGLTCTLNRAIKQYAKGDYIIILASDDIMCEGRIKKQVEFMESAPQYGMSYSNAYYIDSNSVITGESRINPKIGWLFDEFFLGRFNVPAYTIIFRTKVIQDVGYFNPDLIVEDSDILLKISKKYQIGFLNIKSAYYRRHSSNTSSRYYDLYQDAIKRISIYRSEPKFNEAVYQVNKQCFFYLSFNNKREALKIFPKVLRRPFNKFFLAGCLNLIGLSFLTSPYMKFD